MSGSPARGGPAAGAVLATLVRVTWQRLLRGRAKLDVGLAKGKKQHDKRADIKKREWQREKSRVLRSR